MVLHFFCPGLTSDSNPPTYASCIAGIMECTTNLGLFFERVSYYIFAQTGLKP
jgi:hypothetical protein